MMFNENSVVVQAWVRKVKDGTVTTDDVPNLSNLIDVVTFINNAEVE